MIKAGEILISQGAKNVLIKGGKVIALPETWKNTRLGHNKSIQWVCEKVIRSQ